MSIICSGLDEKGQKMETNIRDWEYCQKWGKSKVWASQLSDAGVERLKEQSVKRKYAAAGGQLPERKIHALRDFGAVDYVLMEEIEVENENQNW